MVEVEAKFLIEDSDQIPRLIEALRAEGFDVQPASNVEIVDRYLDTSDWHVLRQGWVYRWRSAGGQRIVGLKSIERSERHIRKRVEVEEQVTTFPRNGSCSIPSRILQEIGDVSSGNLHELFRIQNDRRLFTIRTDQGAVFELAVDHAVISASDRSKKQLSATLAFDELEVELKEGTEESLEEIVETISRQPGLLPARLSKFERGLHAAGLVPPLSETDLPLSRDRQPKTLTRRDQADRLAVRCLQDQFDELLRSERLAWEGLDPEGVHRMRIAIRRIRAAFRAFPNILPAQSKKELNRDLKWLAGVLGDMRDLDVYHENLHEYVTQISDQDSAGLDSYRDEIATRRRETRRQLLACLVSSRYERLKTEFARVLRRGHAASAKESTGRLTIGRAARKIIGKQYRRVIAAGRTVTADSPDDALHSLRIECKRLRYAWDIFRPIYGKSCRPFIRSLKALQNILGEVQDARVATERLRDYAESVPLLPDNRGQLLALGQLIRIQQTAAAEQRSGFARVWKRFDGKRQRKAFRTFLQKTLSDK